LIFANLIERDYDRSGRRIIYPIDYFISRSVAVRFVRIAVREVELVNLIFPRLSRSRRGDERSNKRCASQN